ncbi:MAG: hypothetical protein NWF05_11295 [Candidatus Bathyarchaeota archaeon]|nr:hypothetical protein [Candidatus Bathyarchaeota archaeon]
MSANVPSVLALSMLVTPTLLLVMLLPAYMELKKPKDAGPRRIMPSVSPATSAATVKVCYLLDIDEHHKMDVSLKPFLRVILDKLTPLDV